MPPFVGMLWRTGPGLMAGSLVLRVVRAGLPIATLFVAKLIIDERTKGGPFKDWADFEKRVKGVKEKSAQKLSAAGLTVGGKSLEGAPTVAAAPKKAAAK